MQVRKKTCSLDGHFSDVADRSLDQRGEILVAYERAKTCYAGALVVGFRPIRSMTLEPRLARGLAMIVDDIR